MDIKINLTVFSATGSKDATDLLYQLQNRNIKKTLIEQKNQAPTEGQLDLPEPSNIIEFLVTTGFALGTIKSIFDVLKGRWIDIPIKKIEAEQKKIELEIEQKKIESKERIELAKVQSTEKIAIENDLTNRKHNELNCKIEKEKIEFTQSNTNQAKEEFIELSAECGSIKFSSKLNSYDEQQISDILEKIKEIEKNCNEKIL